MLFRYHPLFRAFLISCARVRFAPDELLLLLRKTSLILTESGQTGPAAELLAEVMDWDNLVRLIINHAKSLMAEGRIITLEAWLRRLPDDTLGSNPHLLYLIGLCRMPFDIRDCRSFLERAFLAFEEMRDTNNALMVCFAIMDAILAQGSDYKALGKWIDWLDHVEERGFHFPSPELELEAASKMLFATYYQPWHPRIGFWRSRAEALITHGIDAPHLITAGISMVIHYVFFGLMHKAAILLETLRPRVASNDIRPFYRVQWQMAETLYAVYGSASREAYLEATGKGKALSLQTGIPVFDRLLKEMDSPLCAYIVLLTDAYFALKRGQEPEGLELIGMAMALGRKYGIMTFPYSTPAVMGYICAKSLEAGIEPEYSRELILKHNLKPDISGIAMEAWPYPVKIYTLCLAWTLSTAGPTALPWAPF